MNIFVVSPDPWEAARMLPDKHIVKMPTETAQMLAYINGPEYHNRGVIHKKDGTPYKNQKLPLGKHPCTKWAAESISHEQWLIYHGHALCREYTYRYGKIHAASKAITEAFELFLDIYNWKGIKDILISSEVLHTQIPSFVRAMPDHLKNDNTIGTVEAYRRFIQYKEWPKDNYLKDPTRKPNWLV